MKKIQIKNNNWSKVIKTVKIIFFTFLYLNIKFILFCINL